MKRRTFVAAAAAVFLGVPASAPWAADGDTIRIIGFRGASSLPVQIAEDKGLFKKNGVNVAFTATRGSKNQFRDLKAGKYDVAATLIDNVIAYSEGQGAAKEVNFDDLAVFLGVHGGKTSLVGTPDIKSIADLKGKKLGVDALTTGFAFVLLKVLEKHGLKHGVDYQTVSVGNSRARLKALKEGKVSGALLSPPRDIRAKAEGLRIVANAAAELGNYQGSVYAARRGWLKANEKSVVGFIRAIVDAHGIIFNDKEAAVATLLAHNKRLKQDQAEAIYKEMTEGVGGLHRKAEVKMKGVETVLALRNQYGVPRMTLTDPSKYLELSYYKKATGM